MMMRSPDGDGSKVAMVDRLVGALEHPERRAHGAVPIPGGGMETDSAATAASPKQKKGTRDRVSAQDAAAVAIVPTMAAATAVQKENMPHRKEERIEISSRALRALRRSNQTL